MRACRDHSSFEGNGFSEDGLSSGFNGQAPLPNSKRTESDLPTGAW